MDDAMLEEYVNDHLAGAAGATRLLRRLSDRLEDAELRRIVTELEEEQAILLQLMDDLGLDRGGIRRQLSRLGEHVSRVLRDVQAARQASLRDLLELEAMLVGIEGKRALWRSLMQIADAVPEVGALPLESLHDQAFRQAQVVESRRLLAADTTLATP